MKLKTRGKEPLDYEYRHRELRDSIKQNNHITGVPEEDEQEKGGRSLISTNYS